MRNLRERFDRTKAIGCRGRQRFRNATQLKMVVPIAPKRFESVSTSRLCKVVSLGNQKVESEIELTTLTG